MKKFLFVLLALLSGLPFLHAQPDTSCLLLPLETPTELKAAEPCVADMANWVLTQPMKSDDPIAIGCLQRVFKWMEGTPEHSFNLGGPLLPLFKGKNQSLLGIYLSCLTKAALQGESNPDLAGLKLLADYIKNPANKVKKNKGIKAFITAAESGDLSAYVVE